jgi:hypothetical protein
MTMSALYARAGVLFLLALPETSVDAARPILEENQDAATLPHCLIVAPNEESVGPSRKPWFCRSPVCTLCVLALLFDVSHETRDEHLVVGRQFVALGILGISPLAQHLLVAPRLELLSNIFLGTLLVHALLDE